MNNRPVAHEEQPKKSKSSTDTQKEVKFYSKIAAKFFRSCMKAPKEETPAGTATLDGENQSNCCCKF